MKLLTSIFVGFYIGLKEIPWLISIPFSFKAYKDMEKGINEKKVKQRKKEIKLHRWLYIFAGLIVSIIMIPIVIYFAIKGYYKNPEEFYEEEYETN